MGDKAALGTPHGISWENNPTTRKLTIEPSPKTKEQQPMKAN